MLKYADVYLLPILEENVPRYKKLATAAGKLFMKNGALKYREYVASDLNTEDVIPFPKVISLSPARRSSTHRSNSVPSRTATK